MQQPLKVAALHLSDRPLPMPYPKEFCLDTHILASTDVTNEVSFVLNCMLLSVWAGDPRPLPAQPAIFVAARIPAPASLVPS